MNEGQSSRARFLAAHPDGVFLEGGDLSSLTSLFERANWLLSGEHLEEASPAARDTSQLVLRVRTNLRSLLVKQARPWLERNPSSNADDERSLIEAAFYRITASDPLLSRHHPRMIGAEAESRVLVLEDLGKNGDFTDLYRGARVSTAELNTLVAYLSSLHALPMERDRLFTRNAARQERYDALFVAPLFASNEQALEAETPGLSKETERLRADERFFDGLRKLGEAFLEETPWLVHGDFVPSNWLRTPARVYVIDGENAMMGRIELDIGMMLAHLMLTGQASPGWVLDEYEPPEEFDLNLALGFAGAELIRRLIGPDRVPTHPGLMQKKILLSLGKELVLRPDRELLG